MSNSTLSRHVSTCVGQWRWFPFSLALPAKTVLSYHWYRQAMKLPTRLLRIKCNQIWECVFLSFFFFFQFDTWGSMFTSLIQNELSHGMRKTKNKNSELCGWSVQCRKLSLASQLTIFMTNWISRCRIKR